MTLLSLGKDVLKREKCTPRRAAQLQVTGKRGSRLLRSPLHPRFGPGCSIFHLMQFHVCSKTLCNPASLGGATSTKCFKVAIVINSSLCADPTASFGFGRMWCCVMSLELASIQNYIPKGLLVKPHDNWFLFSYDFILSGLKHPNCCIWTVPLVQWEFSTFYSRFIILC